MRLRSTIAGCCAVLAVLTLGTGPALAAQPRQEITDYTGSAGSHALRISIGDTVVTIGGGQSNAMYERVSGETVQVRNAKANAKANAIVIPGLATSQASCSPPKLKDSISALATPASFDSVLKAKLATANCAVSVAKLPSASHSSGEIDATTTLTQSLVTSVSDVNAVLDSVQNQLSVLAAPARDQANKAITAIKANLASDAVLDVKVAPNRGSVNSTADGIASDSPGAALTLSLLGGVIQIEVAVADTSASIAGGRPKAKADVAFVHVKALDITGSNPGKPLIDQKINAPGNVTLLAGTPLETRIVTDRGTTSTACTGALKAFSVCASSVADGVSLKLLASPFPTIGVELVHTQTLAAGALRPMATTTTLPRTGAAAAATVLSGLVLAAGALRIRRMLVR